MEQKLRANQNRALQVALKVIPLELVGFVLLKYWYKVNNKSSLQGTRFLPFFGEFEGLSRHEIFRHVDK